MNIFVLNESPILSAQWQHDRHVVKMILESAQMLSTACRGEESVSEFSGLLSQEEFNSLYKSTHVNHPCNIWVRESWANFAWLTLHLDALISEYHRRFQRVHATQRLRWIFNNIVSQYLDQRFYTKQGEARISDVNPVIHELAAQYTPFAVCMPDDCKIRSSPIMSYRHLYITSKIFQDHVKWTRCDSIPEFLRCVLEGDERNPLIRSRIEKLISANREQNAPSRVEHTWIKPPKFVDTLQPVIRDKPLRFGIKS